MLSTKDIISIDEVPETWIFEHYAGLTQNLLGEDVTIKSLFKPNEKTPSMKIFNKDGRYFYKDFSSDNGGTAFGLVQKLYGLNYGETVSKIVEDYKSHGRSKIYVRSAIKTKQKTVIDSYNVRPWTNRDVKFWSKYNIGSIELINCTLLVVLNVLDIPFFVSVTLNFTSIFPRVLSTPLLVSFICFVVKVAGILISPDVIAYVVPDIFPDVITSHS